MSLSNATRIARRELRGGLKGFRVFLACLALGVAAIAAVGSVRHSVELGLQREGAAILGGDAEIQLTYRFAETAERAWMDHVAKDVSEIVDFRSMAVVTKGTQTERGLTQVKAVDSAYPLYGAVVLSPKMSLEVALQGNGDLPGAVMDPVLIARLALKIGDKFRLGTQDFILMAALEREPDSAGGGFTLGPRTIVRTDALMDSIPLIVLTGQVATNLIGTDAFQETDMLGMALGIVKHSYLVEQADELPGVLEEAFKLASEGRPGPVWIDIPKDIQFQTAEYTVSPHITHRTYRPVVKGDIEKIKQAVEQDQLQLFFQPKMCLENESAISVETLLRWQHPKQGLVPPEEFIPFAEQTGAIRLITAWVIRNAVAQCGRWHKEGLSIKMSLNISARDLLDPKLPELTQQALDEHQVPASAICYEITESALMEDPVKAHQTVTRLYEMGIEISIDDYGTGYSSLAYVKKLPIHELKIDREFVKNMIDNHQDTAIVQSTIELGHNLGLKVVAEGIESEEELAMLKRFGCDQVQGFLISRAMAAGDFESWIEKYLADLAKGRGGEQVDESASTG